MGGSERTQLAASALDAIPEAYIVLDEQFRFVYMNRAARAFRCKDKPDLVGPLDLGHRHSHPRHHRRA